MCKLTRSFQCAQWCMPLMELGRCAMYAGHDSCPERLRALPRGGLVQLAPKFDADCRDARRKGYFPGPELCILIIQSLTVKSRPRSTDRGSRPSRSVGRGLGRLQPPVSRPLVALQARFEPRSVGRPGFQRFHAPSRSVGLGRLSHPHNGPSLGRSVGPTSLSTVLL